MGAGTVSVDPTFTNPIPEANKSHQGDWREKKREREREREKRQLRRRPPAAGSSRNFGDCLQPATHFVIDSPGTFSI